MFFFSSIFIYPAFPSLVSLHLMVTLPLLFAFTLSVITSTCLCVVSTYNPSILPSILQRIKAVAAPVRGGASSRPADHRGPKDLAYPMDPNGNNGLLMKAPTHTIVETMM